jgi:inosine-uridine nucleoside N-ribohydrolase
LFKRGGIENSHGGIVVTIVITKIQRLMTRVFFSVLFLFVFLPYSFSQAGNAPKKPNGIFGEDIVKPRMRVIIDNDFGGDPDGLFQLVHHLLSPSVEIRAIIGSHLRAGDPFDPSKEQAVNAKKKIEALLATMNLSKAYPVYQGSNIALIDKTTPHRSEAAEAIVKEAMREDTKQPLYVVCGAGLTEIASAYLMEPAIAKRLTLIWIGGPEYVELAPPPPGYTSLEYNLGIDIMAGQVIFNNSEIPIWQIPRNVYRQMIYPYSSLLVKVKPQGKIGNYLTTTLEELMKRIGKFNYYLGEVYILGDSPLVLLTALQSSFEADPSSSDYVLHPSPLINDQGLYEVNHSGRNIRVYQRVDAALVFEDFISKLVLFNERISN